MTVTERVATFKHYMFEDVGSSHSEMEVTVEVTIFSIYILDVHLSFFINVLFFFIMIERKVNVLITHAYKSQK